jgi:Contractile injection system tube protein
MPAPQTLKKAQLIELVNGDTPGKTVTVQFNPQSLKSNYSNQSSEGVQPQGSSPQFVGTGVTKLSMELWFDVTLPLADGTPTPNGDVRKLTDDITYFIRVKNTNSSDQQIRTPPKLRFEWGSFRFSGVMESMDETIDLFSSDGVPLRANVTISLSKHDLTYEFAQSATGSPNATGATPLTTAKAGDSLPQMAASAGISNWQGVAQANGVANPRLLQTGALINLSISV